MSYGRDLTQVRAANCASACAELGWLAAMMCLTSEKELTQTERKKLQRHAGQFAAALDGLDSTGKGAKSVLRTLDQQLSKLHAHAHKLTKMTTWNNPLVSMPVSDRTEVLSSAIWCVDLCVEPF